MQKYGPKTTLGAFRREAVHRRALCNALAEDKPALAPVGEAAGRTVASVDAKAAEVQRAEDLLIEARAMEKARKIATISDYEQSRRDLAAEAHRLVPVLLPTAPSTLKKAGIGRVRALVAQAVSNLRLPETPAAVRDEHLPVLEAELVRLETADKAEDVVAANLSSLRAALVLFKADREVERVAQYSDLVKVFEERSLADEFFLSLRSPSGTSSRSDEGAEETGEDEDTEETP